MCQIDLPLVLQFLLQEHNKKKEKHLSRRNYVKKKHVDLYEKKTHTLNTRIRNRPTNIFSA